jgi:hypothetical protein
VQDPILKLTHQDQAELKIPEHRADVAIIPDPVRGASFIDTLVIDVPTTAATSTATQAAAGLAAKDEETGAVTAGARRDTGKAAEEKAKGKAEFYSARLSLLNNMQSGTFVTFALETRDFLHARRRLLL